MQIVLLVMKYTESKILAYLSHLKQFSVLLVFFVRIIFHLNFAQLSVRGLLFRASFWTTIENGKKKMSQ